MTAPPAHLRFGVRAISGRRASTWKAFTLGGDKSDFYVGCRELGGEMKASFHQSGNWHISYSKNFLEDGFDLASARPETRFIDTWTRPPEIAPGVTVPLRIVVPWASATVSPQPEPEDCVWVNPAPEGSAVEFAVVLTAPNCQVTDWPARRSIGSELIGSFALASGERVWIIWSIQPFVPPPLPAGKLAFFKGKTESSVVGSHIRAAVLAVHTDGSRIFYDAPVERGDA